MLKLKLQYFGHLMRRTDSLEKTPMLGKIESRRRRGQQRMRWLDGLTDSMTGVDDRVWASSGSWWWTAKPGVLQSMGLQRVRHDWVTELNWTEFHRRTSPGSQVKILSKVGRAFLWMGIQTWGTEHQWYKEGQGRGALHLGFRALLGQDIGAYKSYK